MDMKPLPSWRRGQPSEQIKPQQGCGVGTALAWPSGSSFSASSMASPVDASSTGDLVGKGWAGGECGEGVMGEDGSQGADEGLQGLLGVLRLGWRLSQGVLD